MQKKQTKGFTTIEILVVIAVIAVLAAGIILAVQRARQESKNSELKKTTTELVGVQETIKSEQGKYAGHDGNAFEDQRIRQVSDEIKEINGEGLEDDRLVQGTQDNWGMITPSVNQNAVYCLSSKTDTPRRKNVNYDSSIDYTFILKDNGWDCTLPDSEFSSNPVPGSNTGTTTSYARVNEEVRSDPFIPSDYNSTVTVTISAINAPSGTNPEIKNLDTGAGWSNSVTLGPGDELQLQTQFSSSSIPSSGTADYELEYTNGSDTATGTWTLNNIYASCDEIHDAGYTTTDNNYVIDPDKNGTSYSSFQVRCDMNTDGGGWTRITLDIAKNELNGRFSKYDPNTSSNAILEFAGIRPLMWYQGGGSNQMMGRYDFDFPNNGNGFEEFYLSSGYTYEARTNITSDIMKDPCGPNHFKQPDWKESHLCSEGDISFGTAGGDPVASYARIYQNPDELEDGNGTVRNYYPSYISSPQTYSVSNSGATTFRIGAAESGSQDEGWYVWNSGYIYLK